MPRTARASVGGVCYHVINRGNAGAQVFGERHDYAGFVDLFELARQRVPMRLLAYCLMPNHFHLLLWPRGDADLSRWMQWVLTSHVRRHHGRHGTCGHIWQGRFKAFPIQGDRHFLTVQRYVERNPLRAGLVNRAQDWPWSSLYGRRRAWPAFLTEGPVARPSGWVGLVNEPMTAKELVTLRHSVHRGTPFGSQTWVARVARRLGLESTLRPRGRPRKSPKK